MKITFLLATLLISSATFAGVKNEATKKVTVKNAHPQNEVIINIDHLRSETKNVSMLKPVFAIMNALQRTAEKLHGKTLKFTVTNALLTTTNVQ